MRSSLPVIASVCVVLSAAGCGSKPVPTKGLVTFEGKPLANATVMFVPEDADGKPATGYTDASGAFHLTTFRSKDGALPGSYKVTVQHSEPINVPPAKSVDDWKEAAAKVAESRKPSEVPEIYAQQDQTPLKHRVPQDGDATFKLSRTPP